jgi:hypothetical protein
MNFSRGGGLVYILRANNGTYAFLLISLISVAILFMWFYTEGFFDMLATRETNKHIRDLEKQHSTLESMSKSVSFSSTRGSIMGVRSSPAQIAAPINAPISRPIPSSASAQASAEEKH